MEIKQKVQFVSDKFVSPLEFLPAIGFSFLPLHAYNCILRLISFQGAEKGKQLLTNACFKAVNQSIGRAIRHANDYAAIILLDARFLSTDSQAQLPDWIRKKYERCTSLGKCIGSISKFFISKRSV